MPTPTKKRRRTKEDKSGARKKAPHPIVGKEFNYVLQLNAEDTARLARYRDVLVQGAAGFAETTYNYLFDNPDIADVMYAYERQGGNIGELVRGHLQHQLDLLSGEIDDKATARSEELGRQHFRLGVKPVWSIGAYRLFQTAGFRHRAREALHNLAVADIMDILKTASKGEEKLVVLFEEVLGKL